LTAQLAVCYTLAVAYRKKLGLYMSIVDEIEALGLADKSHVAGAFPSSVLKRLEQLMPQKMTASAETGCGKSTILFSNLSKNHAVFCIDDTHEKDNSSINFFRDCPLTKNKNVELVLGPTQETLPQYRGFKAYDCVLIDGPHGFPFPEIEYYYFYPHMKPGSILIVDDVHINTIGRLADFIAEDAMWDFVELVSTTAVFRRTGAPTFDPTGDGWWTQDFNRRRIPQRQYYPVQYRLDDGKLRAPFAGHFPDDHTAQIEKPAASAPQRGFLSRLFGG
jgi:predicted O-methyltransferase YrrM